MTRAAAIFALAFLVGCGGSVAPEDAVAASFRRVIEGLAEADGDAVADQLSAESRELFQEVVDRAVDDSDAELRRASPAVRLAVHLARQAFGEARLARMDGAELCAAMVGQGWVSPYADVEVAFEVPPIAGTEARLLVGEPTRRRRPSLTWVEEGAAWKLDLTASRADADRIADELFRYGGGNEEDVAAMILGR